MSENTNGIIVEQAIRDFRNFAFKYLTEHNMDAVRFVCRDSKDDLTLTISIKEA